MNENIKKLVDSQFDPKFVLTDCDGKVTRISSFFVDNEVATDALYLLKLKVVMGEMFTNIDRLVIQMLSESINVG